MTTVPVLLGAPRASAYDLVLPGGGHVALEGDDVRLARGLTVR